MLVHYFEAISRNIVLIEKQPSKIGKRKLNCEGLHAKVFYVAKIVHTQQKKNI